MAHIKQQTCLDIHLHSSSVHLGQRGVQSARGHKKTQRAIWRHSGYLEKNGPGRGAADLGEGLN